MNFQERIEKMAAKEFPELVNESFAGRLYDLYDNSFQEKRDAAIWGAKAAVKLLAEGSREYGPRVTISTHRVSNGFSPQLESWNGPFYDTNGMPMSYCPVSELIAAKARIAELEAVKAELDILKGKK